jgi:hypothetical protein
MYTYIHAIYIYIYIYDITFTNRKSSSSYVLHTVIVVVAVVGHLYGGMKTSWMGKGNVTSIRKENLHRYLPKLYALYIID